MIGGALAIGFSPIISKAMKLPPSTIGFYRFFIGFVCLALILLMKKSKIDFMKLKKMLVPCLLGGFFFSCDLWLWHRSIIYIGAGISTLLANTQVLYLVLIGILFLGERPRWYFFLALFLTALGVIMTTSSLASFDFESLKMKGIFYGLLTGLSYSFVTLSLKKANEQAENPGAWPIFLLTFFASIFSFIFIVIEKEVHVPQGIDIVYALIYGGVIHAFGWILISKAIRVLPVALVSLILLLQPVFATILGVLIYHEEINIIQGSGLVLSLVGIYIAMVSKEKKKEA
ncbi:EamA-like transporter family protein [Bacteriovorax sp. Seq25_V]|nr:EamA-like transporter family protein [Bacteriovorax sp. Seq25_V]